MNGQRRRENDPLTTCGEGGGGWSEEEKEGKIGG